MVKKIGVSLVGGIIMKRNLLTLVLIVLFLVGLQPLVTQAHPGRTDSSGGHTCKTNCDNWGLKDGEYHYHNGSDSTNSENSSQKDQVTTSKGESLTALVLPKKQDAGTLQVYYMNVHQGDSTLIRTPDNQYILIDGGDNSEGKNVVKYLKHLGVTTLEAIVATHPDADHIGGLDDVLYAFKVKAVYAPKVSHTTDTYKDFLLAVKKEGLTIKSVKKDVSIPLKGVTAKFVAPVNTYGNDLNEWSAVLRLQYKNNSFLFTGDAEIKSEQDMIRSKTNLKADVLKISHHGSKTSSSKAFISAVSPKYAVISVGKDNKYGHPNSGVLERLKSFKAQVYRTDMNGTITAISNGSKITFETTQK